MLTTRLSPFCSGLSDEAIDAAVQEAKKDMFSLRIKFAKREVRALPAAELDAAASSGRQGFQLQQRGLAAMMSTHPGL